MTAEVFKFQMYYILSQWQLETRVLIEVRLKLSYLEGNKSSLNEVIHDFIFSKFFLTFAVKRCQVTYIPYSREY